MLVIFPAGEVSHFRWNDRTVTDGEWNTSVARMVGIAADVPVVPLYVEGANSLMFQLAGMAHSAFRTALLCRELLNKSGRYVEVRAGAAIPPDKLKAMPTAREQTDYLRWRTYLLASREPFKPRTALPLGRKMEARREPIAAPLPANDVADEVAGLAGELHAEPVRRPGGVSGAGHRNSQGASRTRQASRTHVSGRRRRHGQGARSR